MDLHYDKDAAGNRLEEIAKLSRASLAARNLKSIVHMADINLIDVDVRETNAGRKNWRLCIVEEDDELNDELVIRVQGILTKNNLVPRNVQSCAPNKAQYLSQHIEICGAATSTFTESMANLQAVADRFEHQLAGIEIAPMQEVARAPDDIFVASNRIFTLKSDVPAEQDNFFQDGVDSAGLLHKLKRRDYIHAPENIVKYYRKKNSTNAGMAYVQFYPGGFQIGDIVELQVSFVAVATGRGKAKITTRLHAVTLLDSKYSNDAATSRSASALRQLSNPAIRKKVGYSAEDEEDARKVKKARTETPDRENDT
ncbi:hypothetical protein C8F04DRAFT_1267335 [Mycena alexandri]|uniref:Uncharacterized protein n=1 Tax=Mycena alexandri TaxID=1745969 RepID=A0AAD6SHZ9_9AGAR|nr:hypothetical protein C8F04DRAFT_1267335 [Mycena alexandri]